MTEIEQLAVEMSELKATMKNLSLRYDKCASEMTNLISLGEADAFDVGNDAYEFNDVRIKQVQTSRWKYDKDTTAKIADIKAQAELEGTATKTTTTSLRLTAISD